jgi:hypothetical protein
MTQEQQFKVPQQMREYVEWHIEQTHAACNLFLDNARQTHVAMQKIVPNNPASDCFMELQEWAMKYTQQNLDEIFRLVREFARASDLKEAVEIQSKHAQNYAVWGQYPTNVTTSENQSRQ